MNHVSEDSYLLTALERGEQTAFDRLFRKYYPLLCAYGKRFVELEDAEEIAQDTLLWLWEHHDSLPIESSLGGYLLKSVYRRSLNRINSRTLKNAADTRFFEDMQGMMEDTDFYQFQELTQKLKEAVDALPATYREAFLMHRFKNMSYKEIAERLGVSAKTVDYRIGLALKQLRKELKDYLPFFISLLF